ncbi:1b4ce218-86a6-4313-b594-c740c4f9975a [Sclerotinia trifoliorum]|uniref:1b4ce218-86a6-4313-b594-c740c4f9975a n=1 Tax=Sclerotinia trifoliorum TaxID=28548 RepID=A0A8H2VLB3_9HELO|nr:1b4ce218-86a6-4313-b594-c740c4f9975a [Sclerotinia trifoliorum]
MSVNVPTDPDKKEADIARKLQFYGIYKAFQAGKVPDNDQIDVALNSFLNLDILASPPDRLSDEGKNLIQEFRSVVEQAKYLLLTKNDGELLQDFIWQCQQIDGGAARAPGAPVDQATAQQHGRDVKEGLRTLGQLILTNGQFRKLLNDAVVLLRDIAGDAATNIAGRVNPSGDQLSQIDHPAEDNVWHDSPNMSSGNIKNQMRQAFKKNQPVGRDDVRDAVGTASQTAHPSGSRDPADTAQLAGRDQQYNAASGIDAQTGAQVGADTLKQRASENVPEETKQRGRETRDRTKNYLQQKMPEERRGQLIYRLKKMVVEIQGHPDYMQSIDTLLDLAEQYGGHAHNIGQHGSGAVRGARGDTSLRTAERDLKTLIERFANYTSIDDFIDSINVIYRDADRDEELKNWFKQMDTFIRKCLKEQGYIMEDNSTERWNELYDKGNDLLRHRYKSHTDRVVDELKFLAKEFDNDAQNKRFAETCQNFFNHLGNDENGKPKFKKHLLLDLSNVIIPTIIEDIRYMPIPRLEYRDPKLEFAIENLVIESSNLMPNLLEIHQESTIRFGRKGREAGNKGSFLVAVEGIQMDLRDVSYYMNRRGSSLLGQDQGVLDILLGDSGLSFRMKLSVVSTKAKDRQSFLKVDSVRVDIKKLKLKIKQSKHKALLAAGKPFLIKPLTKALAKSIEAAIKQKVEEVDAFAYKIKLEADRAKKEAANNPENVPNMYRNYVSAFQRELSKGKEKAERAQQSVQNKEFKMVTTTDESMFPNLKLPGGISSKATEYKNSARQGDRWKSQVFGIGTAQRSNDIPSPEEIRRKPHSVAQGGVRDPQDVGNTNPSTGPSGYNQGAQQGSSQQGYGQQGALPHQGYGQQGFNQQVDVAFANAGAQPGILQGNSAANGAINGGAGNQKNTPTGGNTLLGSDNPVYQGRV